jgi:metallophosphoesterase (TIGR00282 family)
MERLSVLVLGDVVGQSGCRAIFTNLPALKKKHKADLVIVNGENAADGRGMMPENVELFFRSGVDVITSGNHIWHNRDIIPLLDKEDRLLRPENYPVGVPGKGHCIVRTKDKPIGIINLEGRVFLSNVLCPFIVASELLARMQKETNIIIIDFHAEWPEEKEALAIHLDGTVSAIFGTHTHVQTADERILVGGTGYITDVGMTGPRNGVIGMNPKIVLDKNISQMPLRMEVLDGQADIMGLLIEIDTATGKATSIKRIWESSIV